MIKEKATIVMTWFQNAPMKQKLIVGLGVVLTTALLATGVSMAISKDSVSPNIAKFATEEVTVNMIDPKATAQTVSVPAETVVVEPQTANEVATTTETNAVTEEVAYDAANYSTGDEGGRYESPQEPVYEAPAYEAPAYEAPVYEAPAYEAPVYEAPTNSNNDWDVGGDAADKTTGGDNYGTGVGN